MDRYVITTSYYIYADDDKKAKSLAKYIGEKQRRIMIIDVKSLI